MTYPNHHIVTTTYVNGQTGKTLLCLMLLSYLGHQGRGPVLALDFARRPGLYFHLAHLFGCSPESPHIEDEGCKFITPPNSNLILVRPTEDDEIPTQWDEQVKWFNDIQTILRKNHKLDFEHVVTESNLFPDDNGAKNMFRSLEYNRLWIWTVWVRQSLGDIQIYNSFQSQQGWATEPKRIPNWVYVHNPWGETRGRDSNKDMPSMRNFHGKSNGPDKSPREMLDSIGKNAQDAQNEIFVDDDAYWKFIYGSLERPKNLLSVFRRSETYNENLAKFFRNIPSVQKLSQLYERIDQCTNEMYSTVYQPYFFNDLHL